MPPPFNPRKGQGPSNPVRRTETWWAPDELAWAPTPPFAITTATVAQQAANWPEQPAFWQLPIPWRFAPDDAFEGLTPPTPVFNPASGFDWSEQLQLWLPISWFTYEPAVEGLVPRDDAYSGFHLVETPDIQLERRVLWFSPEESEEGWVPLDDAYSGFHLTETPDIQVWQRTIWFAPDAAVEGLTPLEDAYSGFDLEEQPALWEDGTPWFAPEASSEGFPPPVAIFDLEEQPGQEVEQRTLWSNRIQDADWTPIPGLTVAAVNQQPIQQSDPTEEKDRSLKWYSPEDAQEGLTPPGVFNATTDFPRQEEPDRQGQVSNDQKWFAPDEEFDGFRPLDDAYSGFDLEEQPGDWRDTRWFAPEASSEGLTPPVAIFDLEEQPGQENDLTQRWATRLLDADWTAIPNLSVANVNQQPIQQPEPLEEKSRQQQWYQVEDATEGLIPPGAAQPFNPTTDFPRQEEPDRQGQLSNAQQWFTPDASVEGFPTRANAYSGFDLEEQPAAWKWTVWFSPDTSVEGLRPLDDAFSGVDLGEQPAAWTAQVWFSPEVTFDVPFIPGVTTQELAALWDDKSGQQDRAIQPTWFVPDAESQVTVPTFLQDPTRFSELWLEQPGQERELTQKWVEGNYHADGPLFEVPITILTWNWVNKSPAWQRTTSRGWDATQDGFARPKKNEGES